VCDLLTTVYNLNNLTASWTVNYIGESDFDNNAVEGQYPDWFNNKVSAYTYHGINLNYFAAEDISIYGGVNNVADKTPPALPNLNSGGSSYNGIGRQYYAGVKMTF
jgi:outer membrane receptor for ferrienterochelin and colicin